MRLPRLGEGWRVPGSVPDFSGEQISGFARVLADSRPHGSSQTVSIFSGKRLNGMSLGIAADNGTYTKSVDQCVRVGFP